jgi:hypothetical protein
VISFGVAVKFLVPTSYANIHELKVPDRVEDIRPRFHKTRNQMGDNDQNDAEPEDDEDDDDSFIEWSLRKCAAASLDMLSGNNQNHRLFPQILQSCFRNFW